MNKTIFMMMMLAAGLCASCSKKAENSQLVEKLQGRIDSLIAERYQIDKVNIYCESFKDHGSSASGQMERIFIRAVPPNPTTEYLANFSMQDISSEDGLTFHGYPVDTYNKRKDKAYPGNPDFKEAFSRLDEIISQVPEHYTYEHLLQLNYFINLNGDAVYEFQIGVIPESKDTSNPKVRKQNLSHVTTIYPRQSRKIANKNPQKRIERKVQHYMTFRIVNNKIILR